nr:hypothetical protein [Tanacetum cinerariifolium]
MSRTNSQAEIVFEKQLVPRANKLVIKNNLRVTSDSHITDTMLRFVVKILRHHKLYKPVSLTIAVLIIYLHQFWTTINHNKNNHTFIFELDTHTFTLTPRLLRTVLHMPPPDPNNIYTKPPSENQILEFIKTLGYDEDPKTNMIVVSKRQTAEAVANMYNEWGQKLKGLAVDDPAVQSLLDLQKRSKARRIESLKQKSKQLQEKDRVLLTTNTMIHQILIVM